MKRGILIAVASLALIAGACEPPPELTEGETYWVKAPLVFHSVDLYTKPQSGMDNWCGYFENGTQVKLVDKNEEWCYIEGKGDLGWREGWVKCIVLLDYEITPIPTPNRTPQRP